MGTLVDIDNTGNVDVEEFMGGCMRLRGGAQALDLASLMYESKKQHWRWSKFAHYCQQQFERVENILALQQQSWPYGTVTRCRAPGLESFDVTAVDEDVAHHTSRELHPAIEHKSAIPPEFALDAHLDPSTY